MFTDRQTDIDALKGFLMILVIISHSSFSLGKVGVLLTASYMPAFFFVTGYTMKPRKIADVSYRRGKRLLVPYFIYGILFTFVTTVWAYLSDVMSLWDILVRFFSLLYSRYSIYYYPYADEENCLWAKGVGQMWFLTAMFLASVLTAVYYAMSQKRRKIVVILYILLTMLLSRLPVLLPWSLDIAFVASVFMIAGGWFAKKYLFMGKIKRVSVCFVVLLLYFILVYFNHHINMSIRIYGDYGIFSVIFFLVIGLLGSMIYIYIFQLLFKKMDTLLLNLAGKGLAWIGRRSITFLCSHMIILHIVSLLGDNWNLNKRLTGGISILCAVIVGNILVVCFQRAEKKYPVFNYL